MSRSTVIALGVLVAAAIVLAIFWPRPPPSPEDVIREKVIKMGEAAEEKNLGYIMDQISDRFRGSPEPLTKDELKQVLAAQILKGNWVRVFIRETEVRVVSDNEATFSGKFIFGRSSGDSLENLVKRTDIEAYQVDATLQREKDGQWRFVSGGYKRIPPGTLY